MTIMRSLVKVTGVRKAAFIICLVLFVFAPLVVHAQDVTMSAPVVLVQPDSVTVKEGDIFNVSVVIENLHANDGMCAVDFILTWNNTILKGLSIEEVLFHSITPQSEWGNIWQIRLTINNTEGSAEDACLWMDTHRAVDEGYCPVNGISGNHTLAIITMEAVGTGSTTLQLPYVQAADLDANCLINVGGLPSEVPNPNYSGNVSLSQPSPTSQPSSGAENDSESANFTLPATTTVSPDSVDMVPQIALSPENVNESQKQDAIEVTEVPFVMLAAISGVFIALPARWRRVRRQH
jgi:hypothetical protein